MFKMCKDSVILALVLLVASSASYSTRSSSHNNNNNNKNLQPTSDEIKTIIGKTWEEGIRDEQQDEHKGSGARTSPPGRQCVRDGKYCLEWNIIEDRWINLTVEARVEGFVALGFRIGFTHSLDVLVGGVDNNTGDAYAWDFWCDCFEQDGRGSAQRDSYEDWIPSGWEGGIPGFTSFTVLRQMDTQSVYDTKIVEGEKIDLFIGSDETDDIDSSTNKLEYYYEFIGSVDFYESSFPEWPDRTTTTEATTTGPITEPKDICGGLLEGDSGRVKVPNHGLLSPGSICVWEIQLVTGKDFYFNLKALRPHSTISLYDEHNVTQTVLTPVRLGQSDIGRPVFSKGKVLVVVLTQNGDQPSDGAQFKWDSFSTDAQDHLSLGSFVDAGEGAVGWSRLNENERLTWTLNIPSSAERVEVKASVKFSGCSLVDPCLCSYFAMYEIMSDGYLREAARVCGRSSEVSVRDLPPHLVVFIYTGFNPPVGDSVDIEWSGY